MQYARFTLLLFDFAFVDPFRVRSLYGPAMTYYTWDETFKYLWRLAS